MPVRAKCAEKVYNLVDELKIRLSAFTSDRMGSCIKESKI
jgi:hypothetical protein